MSGTLADELATVTPLWAQLRVADRARYLERAAQAVIDEFDEICVTIAGESRRPAAEITPRSSCSARSTRCAGWATTPGG